MPQTPHVERYFTGASQVRSSIQTVLIGGLAAFYSA